MCGWCKWWQIQLKIVGTNTKRNYISYLFVLSIAVCSEAFRGVQLDSRAADHLDAALFILHTQRTYTAVHLNNIWKNY